MPPLPNRVSLSPWQEHKQRWQGGCGHVMCSRALNVVLARGDLPCDVLFIGEAPGDSEDVTGNPFTGPAGSLLDDIITQARVELCIECGRVQFKDIVGPTCANGHDSALSRNLRVAF